jgi:hypothetical protein
MRVSLGATRAAKMCCFFTLKSPAADYSNFLKQFFNKEDWMLVSILALDYWFEASVNFSFIFLLLFSFYTDMQ